MRSERNSYAQRHLFNLISAPMVCTVCSFSHTTSTVHVGMIFKTGFYNDPRVQAPW